MKNKLSYRLRRTAMVSSPIMALYGVSPVYLFHTIPAKIVLLAGMGLWLDILLFWLMNMGVIGYGKLDTLRYRQYVLSYLLTMSLHLAFISVSSGVLREQFVGADIRITHSYFMAYPLMSGVAVNTIILIMLNFLLMAYKKERADLEIEQLKVTSLEAQRNALLQQLQPHFLFNTLSVLKSLIKDSAEDAENYTVRLSEFLRYTLKVNNCAVVRLADELKFTADYLELQKMRFGDALVCQVAIPKEVYNLHLPAYALQALVENAIKHNAFTEESPLCIRIQYADNKIHVCNNRQHVNSKAGPGTGLKNLNDRYQMLFQKEIEIEDTPDEFCVFLILINAWKDESGHH